MKSESELRIGITMRASHATAYAESRDALARAWIDFMDSTLPNAAWMPLPNAEGSILDIVRKWGINALILTGGEDIGIDSQRDQTERMLLDWAASKGIPALGICRGMQLMATEAGVQLSPCAQSHIGSRHDIRFIDDFARLGLNDQTHNVNSFHANGIVYESLASRFRPLAIDATGLVEAFTDDQTLKLGLMWHPERQLPFAELDRELVRAFFLHTGR